MGDQNKIAVFYSNSEEDTYCLAKKIGQSLQGNELIFLSGELGAGKTVFVRGLAAGLGLQDDSLVCSPSFTLVNVYYGRVPVYHVDLYRLEGEEEVAELGLEDYLGTGVMAVEWSEKIGRALGGVKKLEVVIEVLNPEERKIVVSGLEDFPEVLKALGQEE
ncbi:MAG: tRNA (adenosine(37)-N6)-threonylcarbamoyltransferase complex ATPase subunit type 1 TsaE [Candidatus Saccharicenans sp.]